MTFEVHNCILFQYYKVHTEEVVEEVVYVDRDRAAAVSLGARDIRIDAKGRTDFLRQEQKDSERDREEDDTWIFTYIKQGQYELK